MPAPSQIQRVAMPQRPVIETITRPKAKTYEAYQAKASVRFGALQIIIGIICMVCELVAIELGAYHSRMSPGIWGGLFFILAGFVGVSAGKYRTSCPIVASMLLSIIAAVLTTCVLAISAAGADDDNIILGYCGYSNCGKEDSRGAINALLGALAVLEAIIAIWSSAISCGAICCGNRSEAACSGQRVQCINQPGQQQILTMHPDQPGVNWGQPGVYAGQPGVFVAPPQYTAYAPQTEAWPLLSNLAPGTYYMQTSPPPVALPQGVTPPGHITDSHQGVTPPAYTTASPPPYQLWAPAPQTWNPTPDPAAAAEAPPPPTKTPL